MHLPYSCRLDVCIARVISLSVRHYWLEFKRNFLSVLRKTTLKRKANTVMYETSLEWIFLFRLDCLASRLCGECYISYLFRVKPVTKHNACRHFLHVIVPASAIEGNSY